MKTSPFRSRFMSFLPFFIFLLTFHTPPGLMAQTAKWTVGVNPESIKAGEQVRILVEIKDPSVEHLFPERHILVGTKAGNIWSLTVPVSSLEWLEKRDEVVKLELSYMVKPQQSLDSASHRASWVQRVQSEMATGITTPYTGKNVIVGVIDIGFQFDHPTFFDTTGTRFRVKRFWNQLDSAGQPPQGFSYGSLYTEPSEMHAHIDSEYLHGNHVAGIAAGSGFGSVNRKYAGVAYDADLVCVNIKYYDENYTPSAKGDLYVANATIIDGLDYIYRYADSVGKPAVVNLSWGMHSGPHDGTSLFDRAIDQLTGKGKLFVGAAGNDGDSPLHLHYKFSNDSISTYPYMYARKFRDREDLFFDAWGDKLQEFKIAIGISDTLGNLIYMTTPITTKNNITTPDSKIVYTGLYKQGPDTLFRYELNAIERNPVNQCPNILAEIINYQPKNYWIVIRLYSDSSNVHLWNSGSANTWSGGGFRATIDGVSPQAGFIGGNAQYSVSENGGTGKNTISVGAYSVISFWINALGDTIWTGTPGQRAFFSSRGPTRDGRIKPDISAPGVDIVSAYNRFRITPGDVPNVVATPMFNGQMHFYGAASGTSMASPHVAGIVALMLQANPDIAPGDALEMIHNSGTEDQFTGNLPNGDWGFGKINAYKAVLLAQSPLDAEEPAKIRYLVYPNPANNRIFVEHSSYGEVALACSIFSIDGRMVYSGIYGQEGIATGNLPAGIYLLKITNGESSETIKLVISH